MLTSFSLCVKNNAGRFLSSIRFPERTLQGCAFAAGIVVGPLHVVDAEVADTLVDNVGAVVPVRLDKPALANVSAVANLQQLVRMINRQ
jgi:hypothetical protein